MQVLSMRIKISQPRFVEYIINDFATSRIKLGDNTIGAMVVCHSSQQAKSLYEI